MDITPDTTAKRNERITARLRRIQGQVAAIERSLIEDPEGTMLLQRVVAARGAMSSLMAYLLEEKLRTLQLDCERGDTIEEMIEILHGYLT
ncbi:MAG TPA: metal-sensing transcriptional repressor [Acidobacteriaceae bacterium]|jgi:DNA-binding FrmR family transcriptional regulator